MEIRNVAIIAHVDHGKTTLVDGMLKQTHTFRENQAEMSQTTILDRNDLEREKGITILAKVASVVYRGVKINIIDTPGHADFSGEVERVINMADGALLLVDAAEGPLSQTSFVLKKAMEQNLKIIVVINKIDRKDARPKEVVREVEEVFLKLAVHEEHLTFPIIYAVSRDGKAWGECPADINSPADLTPLFDKIVKVVPGPKVTGDLPFKMLVSDLDFDNYKGVYAVGKASQGSIKPDKTVAIVDAGGEVSRNRILNVYTHKGVAREEVTESLPGDIIAVTGLPNIAIGQTITDPSDLTPLSSIELTEPTIEINITPNSSPLSGKEGKYYTPKNLEDRLMKEKKTNIGLRIEANSNGAGFIVSGRGELHLAILIEKLRREGYEMQVGRPEIILKTIDGKLSEPFEEVTVEIDKENLGTVIEEFGLRKTELVDTTTDARGMTRLTYRASSRNLLGLRGVLLNKTRGVGLFNSFVIGYFPEVPRVERVRNGALVALESGSATGYSLESLQERGRVFIKPMTQVYEGQVVGINNRQDDIDVNVCKIKKLSNVHNATADVAIQLDEPLVMSLEQFLDFIGDDELLEVTPLSLRLRKKLLTHLERVRSARGQS